MTTFLALTMAGLVTGCVYALTATGLVVTYTTTGVFNFAQGAMGMVSAYAFWQMWQVWDVPLWLAAATVVLVAAPLFGLVLERLVFRRIVGAAADQSLAVTLGLLLVLIGVANAVWPPTKPHVLPRFAAGWSLDLGVLRLNFNQVLIISCATVVAMLLRLLFLKSRFGLAMKAVVDNPSLLALNGLEPAKAQQAAWVLGSSLAALSGVLLAPLVGLNILNLTLLVVNGYAAAMVGRLSSLPRTTAGALGLGLIISYSVGYLPSLGLASHQGLLSTLQQGVPMLLLFAVLVFVPSERLRSGIRRQRRVTRVPTLAQSALSGAVLVVISVVLAGILSETALETGARGMVLSLIVLSLVLLTGYSGQVSLCTLTFAGLGSYAMAKSGGTGPAALIAAGLLSGGVAAVVAWPTRKLKGLYLALATFAFAQVMDIGFFGQHFGSSGTLHVERLSLPGGASDSVGGYFVLTCSVFAVSAIMLLALRRSRFGRRLTALDDSPAASATLGMRTGQVKLGAFVLSAVMAGVGGALYGGTSSSGLISGADFTALQSCGLLLLLRVGGIRTIAGALFAGMTTAVLPVLQQQVPDIGGLAYLATGVAAMAVGRFPDGVGGVVSHAVDRLRSRGLRLPARADGRVLVDASR